MSGSYLSLFSGIGGLDLAVESVLGYECVGQVELDQACQRVLSRHWSEVPRWRDIRDFSARSLTDPGRERYGRRQDDPVVGRVEGPTEIVGREEGSPRKEPRHRSQKVDLVCGGFPCQDLSNAGKRDGFKGERSSLFYELARVVSEVGPRYVLLENVRGLLTAKGSVSSERGSAFSEVLGTLGDLGFADLRWLMLGASDVGAPHRRHRIFLLATHTDRNGQGRQSAVRPPSESRICPPEARPESDGSNHRVAPRDFDWGIYTTAVRRWERVMGPAPFPVDGDDRLSAELCGWMMGFPPGWNEGESRSQRIKQFGNAVVPQQADEALRRLLREDLCQDPPLSLPA